MPGFITHYLFGTDTFLRIPDPSLRSLIRDHAAAFSLGLQGPDVFFYYLPSYYQHTGNIGNIAHSEQTGRFFSCLLESRSLFPEGSSRQQIADAYTLGFLGHYTLDSTAHPFIYAFTHYDADHPPKNKDYFGQHAYLETDLDTNLLMTFRGELPSSFDMGHTIALTPAERSVISRILQNTYMRTYSEAYPSLKVTRRQCRSATRWMQTLASLMRDPSGQKKVLVRLLEKRFIGKPMFSAMIPSDCLNFVHDPFNTSHRRWIHPWTKEASCCDFFDLWFSARNTYLDRIAAWKILADSGFEETQKEAFLKLYGNRSFQSGLPL